MDNSDSALHTHPTLKTGPESNVFTFLTGFAPVTAVLALTRPPFAVTIPFAIAF